jgi:virulence factor Mce-like protein
VKTWRLVANLVVFGLVALALIGYGIVDLLGNPFESSTDVSAVFPTASGVGANFSVELNGVTIGTVSSVRLVRKGAEVAMSIDHGVRVPSDVVASIGIANDLGEQVVELTPRHGGRVAPLRSGAVVPVTKSGVPVQVGQVVAEATRLLRDIPAGKLNDLLRELAQAFQGQSGNMRTIVSASTAFSQQFLRYQQQFTQLLADSPPVMNAVSAAGPQLTQALANTEAMVQVLAQEKTYVKGDLVNGQGALHNLGQLTTSQAPDLGCLIHDVSQLDANLDQGTNLSNLSSSLSLNQLFFHAVTSVAVTGTAKPLVSSEQSNPNQTILRTRLLLPPGSPMGQTYATPVSLPAVKPGAACDTELGNGVSADSQPGFTPAAGGVLDAPSASEGQVRGRGDQVEATRQGSSSTTQIASFHRHEAGAMPVLMVIGGVLLPALLLAWGVRPSRRRTRRRA